MILLFKSAAGDCIIRKRDAKWRAPQEPSLKSAFPALKVFGEVTKIAQPVPTSHVARI